MKYPPKRDRLVKYIAVWPPQRPERYIQPVLLFVTHDCVTKKARVSGNMTITGSMINPEDKTVAEYRSRLSVLNLTLKDFEISQYYTLPGSGFHIQELGNEELSFDSPPEVVCYINQVSAALDQTAVLGLERHIIQREVLTNFMSAKRRWMDEAKWLAESAVFEFTEVRIFKSLLDLKREGDKFVMVLKPSSDVTGATRLLQGHGIGYLLSSADRNKLNAVCQMGKISEELPIAIEYRTLITAGARAFARSMVSHVTRVIDVPRSD
jgi:hypothetical protein